MHIRELIELLQTYPRDTRVVLQGYEDGYDDVSAVEEISIKPYKDHKWYYGCYEKVRPGSTDPGEKAILLFGRTRSEG